MGKECDRFFSPPKRPQRKPNAIYTRTGAQYKAYKTICNITGSLTLILFMRQHVHSEPVDCPMRADHAMFGSAAFHAYRGSIARNRLMRAEGTE